MTIENEKKNLLHKLYENNLADRLGVLKKGLKENKGEITRGVGKLAKIVGLPTAIGYGIKELSYYVLTSMTFKPLPVSLEYQKVTGETATVTLHKLNSGFVHDVLFKESLKAIPPLYDWIDSVQKGLVQKYLGEVLPGYITFFATQEADSVFQTGLMYGMGPEEAMKMAEEVYNSYVNSGYFKFLVSQWAEANIANPMAVHQMAAAEGLCFGLAVGVPLGLYLGRKEINKGLKWIYRKIRSEPKNTAEMDA